MPRPAAYMSTGAASVVEGGEEEAPFSAESTPTMIKREA